MKTLILISALFFTACSALPAAVTSLPQNANDETDVASDESDINDVPAENTDAAAVESATGAPGETNVGTYVGNTGQKPKNLLSLETTALIVDAQNQFESLDPTDAHAQFELISPSGYNLGILKIETLSCLTEEKEAGVCPTSTDETTTIQTLYDGSQVDQIVSETAAEFESELMPITDDTIGGLRLTVAYFEQRFPDGSKPFDGCEILLPELCGKSYRLCTKANDDSISDCGNSEARSKDLLVDLNQDGQFGFLNFDRYAKGGLQETRERPQYYTRLMQRLMGTEILNQFSSSLVIPADQAYTLDATLTQNFRVIFDVTDTLAVKHTTTPKTTKVDVSDWPLALLERMVGQPLDHFGIIPLPPSRVVEIESAQTK